MNDRRKDKEPDVRAWVARLTGERGYPLGDATRRLARLALDTNAAVRLAAAVAARQFVSSSLTIDTPPTIPLIEVVTGGVLSDLHKSPIDPNDPVLPFMYWMALEPLIAFDASHALGFYENSEDRHAADWPMNSYILTRIMPRICDLEDSARREKHLNKAMEILDRVAGQTNLANAALDGLLAGFAQPGATPTIDIEPIFAKLADNPAVAEKAQRLRLMLGKSAQVRTGRRSAAR